MAEFSILLLVVKKNNNKPQTSEKQCKVTIETHRKVVFILSSISNTKE